MSLQSFKNVVVNADRGGKNDRETAGEGACPRNRGANDGASCGSGGDMEKKTAKQVIIILAVIILLGAVMSIFSFQSNADKIEPEMRNGSGNVSMANNTQNTTSAAKNIISIPLEKPPFIKD